MNNFLLFATIIFISARLIYTTTLYFQQNRYETKRYLKWLKQNLNKVFDLSFFVNLFIVIIHLFFKRTSFFLFLLIFLFFNAFSLFLTFNGKYIKPLVYTRRVKTQIVVLIFIYAFSFYISRLLSFELHYFVVAGILAWIFILLMHVITLPIEKSIAKKYLDDAKNILEKHRDLIKIGITGSYGKTSTKYILENVLKQKFYTFITPRSFNTPMGITRCIREGLKNIHEVFICEMGADKVGDIKELMEFVKPKFGIVTSIGPQHLNTFKNIDNIIKEKMQEIELLPQDGLGIVNIDNEYIRNYKIKNNVRILTVSTTQNEADYYAYDIDFNIDGCSFKVDLDGKSCVFHTKLIGKHNVSNCIIAIALGHFLGLSYEEINSGLESLKFIEHRLELKKINGYSFIDNSFNSNPVSAKMALETLSKMPYKKILITPGFIDLGNKQDYYNYEFGKMMKEYCDEVYLVGRKQTNKIYKGLLESGFIKEKIKIFDGVVEAINYYYQNEKSESSIALLENDLPDAFSK